MSDRAPVVTGQNNTFSHSPTSVAATSLFTASDPDGDPITSYVLWDNGAGGGYFALNGVAQATGTALTFSAAQMANVTYVSGTGTDTLYVQASDGPLSSGWSAGFTATGGTDQAPVVTTVGNLTLGHNTTTAAISQLFTVSDPDGDAIKSYTLWDDGAGGYFIYNGATQATGTALTLTAAQISNVFYVATGGGTDTLYVKASDGLLTSGWTNGFTVARQNSAPVVTVGPITLTHAQTVSGAAASSLFTATDPDGDLVSSYAFWDTGTGGGHLVLGGVTQATGAEIDVTYSNLANLVYIPGTTTDTLYVKASDGFKTSAWSSGFTVTPGPDSAPTLNVPNKFLTHQQDIAGIAASNLFTATDSNGDAVTSYAFWDNGAGGGHFLLNGQTQVTGAEFDVTSAQLANLFYVPGTTADTLYMKASDGYLTSAWTAGFTVVPGADNAPAVTVQNKVLTHNQTVVPVLASALFGVNDPDGDVVTSYTLWDNGAGGGYFVLNGVAQASNTALTFTGSQMANAVYYVAGTGADTLYVKAGDGYATSAWSGGFTVSPGPDNAPVVSVQNKVLAHSPTTFSVSPLTLFSVSDPDSDSQQAFVYTFWDNGAGGGYFSYNGITQASSTSLTFAASQMGSVYYNAGTGTDTLYVKVSDGYKTSAWSNAFTVSRTENAPTFAVFNTTLTHAQSVSGVAASSLFSASDADNDTLFYTLWDAGTNGGYLSFNGVVQATGTALTYSASDLANVKYFGGSGADTLYVKVSDGTLTSAWSSGFTVTGQDSAPVVTTFNTTLAHGRIGVSLSSLFAVSDPDGDAITSYTFWCDGAGGYLFDANTGRQASNTAVTFTESQLSADYFYFLTPASPTTLYVKASDGDQTSGWSSGFTVSPGPNSAPVVSVHNIQLTHAQTVAGLYASSLFSATDPDGDGYSYLSLWDNDENGGHLNYNGSAVAAGPFTASPNLVNSNLTYMPGSGTDTLYAKAIDFYGADSGWSSAFTVTPGADTAPTVIGATDANLTHGSSTPASSLFAESDADGDAIANYAFWTDGIGGAHFVLSGATQAVGAEIDIAASQLGNLTMSLAPPAPSIPCSRRQATAISRAHGRTRCTSTRRDGSVRRASWVRPSRRITGALKASQRSGSLLPDREPIHGKRPDRSHL